MTEPTVDRLFRGRSLRRKLVVIVLAAIGSALLFSALALLAYEITTYRRAIETDLSSQARLLAESLTPTLAFDDPKAALAALQAIRSRPQIDAAAVFGADGVRFAGYSREASSGLPDAPGPSGISADGERAEVFLPIREGGEVIGTLYLRGHYELAARLRDYLGILALASAAGLGVGLLIYRRLHPSVTTPILAVADAARRVVKDNDYGVRVEARSDGEVGLLVDAFNGMLDALAHEMRERHAAEAALREADRRKDEFLAIMAHELRNPLAPMLNSLALMRHAQTRPEIGLRARETMERQLLQMIRLVDDLLDVSRITQGRLELRLEPVAVVTIVEQAVEAVEPLIAEKGQSLTREGGLAGAWVSGDAARLTQVLVNLLNNAAKYTPAGGAIVLSAKVSDGELTLAVRDNGIGIAPQDQTAVFDMFRQLDRSLSRTTGGLGIGLTIARQIVQMHGGRLAVQSQGVGRGSTFLVHLPLIEAPVTETPPREVPGASIQRSDPPRPLDVLIADDNVDFAESFAQLLQTEGHAVRVCHDGVAAVRLAQQHTPDVAFLDIGMPGLDGYALARRLRAEPASRPVTLIAVTGWGQDADRERVRGAGFNEHWVKPVDVAHALVYLRGLAEPGSERRMQQAVPLLPPSME